MDDIIKEIETILIEMNFNYQILKSENGSDILPGKFFRKNCFRDINRFAYPKY